MPPGRRCTSQQQQEMITHNGAAEMATASENRLLEFLSICA